VICGLQQPDSGETTLPRPVDYGLHKGPSNAPVLNIRRHRNRPNAGNYRTLIQAIAADDATVSFSDHTVKSRMGKEHPEKTNPCLGCWKFKRERVLAIDSGESLVANAATGAGVVRPGTAKVNRRSRRWI
jgi:hypothetical protein